MQRYFTQDQLNINETFEVAGEDTHHIINVMRFRVDDTFEMVDGMKNVYLCKIINIEEQTVTYLPVEKYENSSEMPVRVTIICPMLKGEKFEWMLQKSTEFGASEFIIYEADRSIVKLDDKKKDKRLIRYRRVIKEASEQSKRTVIPDIHFGGKLKQFDLSGFDHTVIAYEGNAHDQSLSLNRLEKFKDGESLAFIFGPEGGLTEGEAGFDTALKTVRLGPRILRAESAPLYFLSSMSYIYE
ncbi:RsmE family RNA methyltransferase [Lacicoccus qingdaonensis]|uniref:Ribosomal RNA small subunit methyltransferase E n=1 Tax=Lacicoccus qingdaonensis TaxID=576118 RepID=A0A1G9I955_9BACL|nr:RsmE family RNA methyltransferase [Salinicoccus qingdaonensis]SDL21642.1 16S rRNA (uracil1498-N3)-methyltransferase [Salinicoccus qingdaonensis]